MDKMILMGQMQMSRSRYHLSTILHYIFSVPIIRNAQKFQIQQDINRISVSGGQISSVYDFADSGGGTLHLSKFNLIAGQTYDFIALVLNSHPFMISDQKAIFFHIDWWSAGETKTNPILMKMMFPILLSGQGLKSNQARF